MNSGRKSGFVNGIFAVIAVKVAIIAQIPKYILTAWVGLNPTVENLVFGDYGSTLIHVILNGLLVRGPVEFFIFGVLGLIFGLIRPMQRNLPRTMGIAGAVFAFIWMALNFVMSQIKFFDSWGYVASATVEFVLDVAISVMITVAAAVLGGALGARIRS